MKDVISILQSRIAKRSNEIRKFSNAVYENKLILTYSGLLCDLLTKEQKQDKRILAEIIRLRRELKECDVILDRFYRAEEI